MTPGDETVLSAEDLRLDACVAEALGTAPPADLEQRILDRLKSRAPAGTRHRWLLGTLLIAAGVLVASGVAWLQHRARNAAAVATPGPAQEPQEPTDEKLQKQVGKLVRDLELPARRAAATAELLQLGAPALPIIRTALAAEEKRGRAELIQILKDLLVDNAAAKARYGLPPVQVTIVSDYSENRVVCLDAEGKELQVMTDLPGVWDASLTPQGTLLVTQFSTSTVVEFDAAGKKVWQFSELKNPYRASRLQSGNTLIADAFNGRVIEVNPAKEIVWAYSADIRPFDCERLPNGNTLIADAKNERVIEVDGKGDVVWEVKKMNQVHDATRLMNGNTLITLRGKGQVLEVAPDGKVVWQLGGLNSPGEAQRLPNGNTLVAENNQMREFDSKGQVVARKAMVWAVSVKRY